MQANISHLCRSLGIQFSSSLKEGCILCGFLKDNRHKLNVSLMSPSTSKKKKKVTYTKTYITSGAGFQMKRQNIIQGFAKSPSALSRRLRFPRGPGANEAFWLLSHILHIFQFGQAITPSSLLSQAKRNSPLFLFICICSVQSWLLPPALQLFLERRDSLNEFR